MRASRGEDYIDDKRSAKPAPNRSYPDQCARAWYGRRSITSMCFTTERSCIARDYLIPRATDPTAIQIMFHTPTETPGDRLLRHAAGGLGWLDRSHWRAHRLNRAVQCRSLSDEFRHVDEHRIWFNCRTRGDFDGLLIKLAQSPSRHSGESHDFRPDRLSRGHRRIGYASATGPAKSRATHEVNFKLSDVSQSEAEYQAWSTTHSSMRVRREPMRPGMFHSVIGQQRLPHRTITTTCE